MKTKSIAWVASIALVFGWCLDSAEAAEAALPTKTQRLAFLKEYHSWSPRERRASLKRLLLPEYRNNAMVGAALHDIAYYDKDPESRLNAFVALCSCDDRDGRLAYHLSRLFKLELERAIKPRMAQAMTQLKFKTDVINVLIGYTFSPGVNYPHDRNYSAYGGDGRVRRVGGALVVGGTDGWRGDRWHRSNYRILLDAINKLTGQRWTPSTYNARQVIRWWNYNAIDFQADDQKLAEEIRKNGLRVKGLGAAEDEGGAAKALAEVLDAEEKKDEGQKRTQEVLDMLEPPANPAPTKVDEDEIE